MEFTHITNLILFTQNDPVRNVNGNLKSVEWVDGSKIECAYDMSDRLIRSRFTTKDGAVEIYEYWYAQGNIFCKHNDKITKVVR